jgi:hypothetical protein
MIKTERDQQTSIDGADLTSYVGATVPPATWAALQTECRRRYAGRWQFHAVRVGENWRITTLHAKPAQ